MKLFKFATGIEIDHSGQGRIQGGIKGFIFPNCPLFSGTY